MRVDRMFALGVAVALLVSGRAPLVADEAPAKRPNILFILVDDQSPFDFQMYNGRSVLRSPRIDRLAAEGMVIDGAYQMGSWSGAVCSPSRHMIMSGRTLWRLPQAGRQKANPKPDAPADLADHTMPAVFNDAGYITMRTCKQGNSYDAANAKFAVRHDAVKRGATPETGSPWHAERVLDFLKQREADKDTRPFLIYFGFSHPHDTRNAPDDLLAHYGAVNWTNHKATPPANENLPPLPLTYLPAHPFDNTDLKVRDEVGVPGVWDHRDPWTIRNEIGRQLACSESIDTQIGRVLDKLEAMGELDNTYIFYTSDHGMAIGGHGLQGKQNLYEHTFRVPFIVKGPGIKPGSRATGNIYLLDVLATMCDLTGTPAPATNDGVSFKPVLMGERDAMRDVVYGAYAGGKRPGIRCVKQGDWKLIKYDSGKNGPHVTQLFNLRDNPDELLVEHAAPEVVKLTGHNPTASQVNLADDPKHAAKRAELEALLRAEMKRYGDPFVLWDQPKN